MFSWRNAESIWSNFHEEFFKLTADWSTLLWSSSWSLVSWDTLSAFPPVHAPVLGTTCAPCSHDSVSSKMILSRQRKAQSYVRKSGNPDSWVTLPWPTSSPWPGKFVGTLVLFFPPLPSPNSPVAPSPLLSLWGAFQSSPTQTLTQALGSYFFPNAHNTFIFQAASSVRKVDNRHPLIQTPAVSAESVQLAQCRVLPRGWLRILHRKEQSGYHLFFYETCK